MSTLMLERQDFIVSGKANTKRLACFLAPTVTDPDDPSAFDLPVSSLKSLHFDFLPAVSFPGTRNTVKNWGEWVTAMEALHRETWVKAGIYDAVMQSTYAIPIQKELVLGLARYWCDTTNTFVFPWGEASVSLEDVTVLGGYSVLGRSVLSEAVGDREMVRVNEVLMEERGKMNKSPAKKVTMFGWANAFMGSGGDVEHVAFLVLWLSQNVFPFTSGVVGRHLHGIAINLAWGRRVALAPAVLASLYRDLTLLKQEIVSTNNDKNKAMNVWSPMQLVQIWAWERFPTLRPQPKPRKEGGEPRMGRWNEVAVNDVGLAKVKSEIESSSGSFIWRPYAVMEDEKCWQLHKFYLEKEKWVSTGPGMCKEFKAFVRIVRASQLVGLNSLEPYYPHRISMQFGMDQDIPGQVEFVESTPERAWKNYKREIGDEKVFIPSRSFQSGVTSRYFEWWKQQKLYYEWWKQQKLSHKNVIVKSKGSNKRKPMTGLSEITSSPISHSLKKRKVISDDAPTSCLPTSSEESKADKSDSESKSSAELTATVERNWNDKQKPQKASGNKVPDNHMSCSIVYSSKKFSKVKYRMGKRLGHEASDDKPAPQIISEDVPDKHMSCSIVYSSKKFSKIKYRMGKRLGHEASDDKPAPQIISEDGRSHSCAELEMIYKPRVNGNRKPDHDKMSPLTCDGADVRTYSPKEPTEAIEISIEQCDKTGNKVSDACISYPPAEPQIQSSELACNGDFLQTDSHVEPTEHFESTIRRCGETMNRKSDGDKLSLVDDPEIPLSQPHLACNPDHIQMENATTRDGELAQIQPSMLERDGEEGIVCNNLLTRTEEAASIAVIESRVNISGDNGDMVNHDESKISTSLNKMEKIREKPIEERITRLEILVALLKEEGMGTRSI